MIEIYTYRSTILLPSVIVCIYMCLLSPSKTRQQDRTRFGPFLPGKRHFSVSRDRLPGRDSQDRIYRARHNTETQSPEPSKTAPCSIWKLVRSNAVRRPCRQTITSTGGYFHDQSRNYCALPTRSLPRSSDASARDSQTRHATGLPGSRRSLLPRQQPSPACPSKRSVP